MTDTVGTDGEVDGTDPSMLNYFKLISDIVTVNTVRTTEPTKAPQEESDQSDSKSSESKPTSTCSSSSCHDSVDNMDDWTVEQYRADCLSLAGDWGCPQCFQPPFSFWDDKVSDVKMRAYEDIQLNDMENEGVLTDRIVAACSSLLRQCPEIGRFTYTKCVLKNKNLSDIRILHYHNYLQYIDLSCNKLTSVSALGGLPFLMYLDVSNNKLRKLLDFKPAPSNLQYVNYANNCLSEIPDLSRFWALIRLNLAHNKIPRITGLFGLRYLTHLNMSHNRLKTIENLSRLPLIKLNLSSNRISQFTSCLEVLKCITHIDVSYNRLKSLILFQNVESLTNLNVCHNNIQYVLDLTYLQNLRYLSELNLSLNPICENSHYKIACLYSCKNLIRLDEQELSCEELLEVRSKFEDNPQFSAVIQRLLVLLNNVNQPNPTALDIFSMEFTHLPMIVLIGLPGNNGANILNTFCAKYKKYCVRAVSYTTRPQMDTEKDGVDYYFIDRVRYSEMLKLGQLLTHFEFNGNYYGFSRSELNKATDKVLVSHMDISSALTLRLSNIKPILVLALPSSEQEHLTAVIQKYTFTKYSSICGKFVPDEKLPRKHVRKLCEKALLDPIHGEFEACCCEKFCQLQADIDGPFDCSLIKKIDSNPKCPNPDEKLNVSFKDQSQYFDDSDSVLLEDDDEVAETKRVGTSVSEQVFVTGNHDIMLSVLSTSELFSQKDPSYCLDNEEPLNPVVKEILRQRHLLFELHMAAPGLFTAMVYTDHFHNTLKKLKEILKEVVQNMSLRQPVFDLKSDSSFHNMIRNRIKKYMTEMQKDYKGEIVVKKHCDVCLTLLHDHCREKPM